LNLKFHWSQMEAFFMPDTQWPRYQVFVQQKPGGSFEDAGSVHAPDLELALLNARDVFARRPECAAMWVVPAERIYSRTQEELAAQDHALADAPGPPEDPQTYYIFCKAKAAGTQTLLGSLQAAGPAQALEAALQQFDLRPPPFVWWVVPASEVVHSDPQDAPSFFAPALDKTFRMSTEYHTFSAMRAVKETGPESRDRPASPGSEGAGGI
jgi:ring-1,2-phenylacetyl-CoA epoxidase subunit PaaB